MSVATRTSRIAVTSRNTRLSDVIDSNICLTCGGLGYKRLNSANDGAIIKIEPCRTCKGYGYPRPISFSRIFALIAASLAIVTFVIIPLARIAFR